MKKTTMDAKNELKIKKQRLIPNCVVPYLTVNTYYKDNKKLEQKKEELHLHQFERFAQCIQLLDRLKRRRNLRLQWDNELIKICSNVKKPKIYVFMYVDPARMWRIYMQNQINKKKISIQPIFWKT